MKNNLIYIVDAAGWIACGAVISVAVWITKTAVPLWALIVPVLCCTPITIRVPVRTEKLSTEDKG